MRRGPRIPLKGGGEQDALTAWRRCYNWGRRMLRYWKRKYRRRERRLTRSLVGREEEE